MNDYIKKPIAFILIVLMSLGDFHSVLNASPNEALAPLGALLSVHKRAEVFDNAWHQGIDTIAKASDVLPVLEDFPFSEFLPEGVSAVGQANQLFKNVVQDEHGGVQCGVWLFEYQKRFYLGVWGPDRVFLKKQLFESLKVYFGPYVTEKVQWNWSDGHSALDSSGYIAPLYAGGVVLPYQLLEQVVVLEDRQRPKKGLLERAIMKKWQKKAKGKRFISDDDDEDEDPLTTEQKKFKSFFGRSLNSGTSKGKAMD